MPLVPKRWKHFTAMALIGDGVLAMVRPVRDDAAWSIGPLPWRLLMRGLRERPMLTRLLGAAEVAGALYWVLTKEAAAGKP